MVTDLMIWVFYEMEPQINADGRRLDRNETSQLTEKATRCAFVVSNTYIVNKYWTSACICVHQRLLIRRSYRVACRSYLVVESSYYNFSSSCFLCVIFLSYKTRKKTRKKFDPSFFATFGVFRSSIFWLRPKAALGSLCRFFRRRDVLGPVSTHPAGKIAELTPSGWKGHLAVPK